MAGEEEATVMEIETGESEVKSSAREVVKMSTDTSIAEESEEDSEGWLLSMGRSSREVVNVSKDTTIENESVKGESGGTLPID